MQRLNIISILLLLQSCNGNAQTKEIRKKDRIDERYAIRMIDEKLMIKSVDSIIVYNNSNLIRNADLFNTSFYRGVATNDFFLVYQNNASTTKTQSTYHLFVNKDDLFLISKEQVDFNRNGIFIAKNYIVPVKGWIMKQWMRKVFL